MSSLYQVFYDRVAMSRRQVLDSILPLMRLIPAKYISECYELKYDSDLFEYREAFGCIKVDNIYQAIEQTGAWEGVSIEYELPYGALAVILWNDEDTNQTTLTIEENSALVTRQNESEEVRSMFTRFMLAIVEALDSAFCIFERDALYATRSINDIRVLLDDKSFKFRNISPIFLAIRKNEIQMDELEKIVPNTFDVYQTDDYIVIQRKLVRDQSIASQ